jgi:hypothetical protein
MFSSVFTQGSTSSFHRKQDELFSSQKHTIQPFSSLFPKNKEEDSQLKEAAQIERENNLQEQIAKRNIFIQNVVQTFYDFVEQSVMRFALLINLI